MTLVATPAEPDRASQPALVCTMLQEGERAGRPRRLNSQQMLEVDAVLRKTPKEAGMSGNLWDGKTLAAWIKRQYGIRLGVRQSQRLFRQLGFRLREPPMVAQADPERQKTHKKTPGPDGRSQRGSVGHRRSAFSIARFALPDVCIPPETKDPVLLHHPTRQSVGYFGAVRLRQVSSSAARRASSTAPPSLPFSRHSIEPAPLDLNNGWS